MPLGARLLRYLPVVASVFLRFLLNMLNYLETNDLSGARGFERKVRVRVQPGGWNVTTLFALRWRVDPSSSDRYPLGSMPTRRSCHWLGVVAASAALAAACLGEDPALERGGLPEAGTPPSEAGGDASSQASPSGDGGEPAGDASTRMAVVECSNGQACRVPDEVCCATADGSASCTRRGECDEVSTMECDSRDDCAPGQFCCGRTVEGIYWSSSCTTPGPDGVACAERPICRTSADCPDEAPCSLASSDFSPPGIKVCD